MKILKIHQKIENTKNIIPLHANISIQSLPENCPICPFNYYEADRDSSQIYCCPNEWVWDGTKCCPPIVEPPPSPPSPPPSPPSPPPSPPSPPPPGPPPSPPPSPPSPPSPPPPPPSPGGNPCNGCLNHTGSSVSFPAPAGWGERCLNGEICGDCSGGILSCFEEGIAYCCCLSNNKCSSDDCKKCKKSGGSEYARFCESECVPCTTKLCNNTNSCCDGNGNCIPCFCQGPPIAGKECCRPNPDTNKAEWQECPCVAGLNLQQIFNDMVP